MHLDETTFVKADEPHTGRQIVLDVFKTIILGTLKDIFNATIGVIWKLFKHLFLCIWYFWSPDIDRPPFSTFNFKEFCKHSFEAVIVTLIFTFFMAKANVFAATNDVIKEEISSSDIIQMGYEAFAFILFAITYFVLVILSVATGRLIRYWITPEVSRKESDILMITFFNSFLSLTALTALLIRCFVSFRDNDLETILIGTTIILMCICCLFTVVWAIRFVYLNRVKWWRAILFFFIAVCIYTIMFTLAGMATTGLLYIV